MNTKEPTIDELERLQNTFLFGIPDFYNDKKSSIKDKLYKLFSPIFSQEYFRVNLKWFVTWEKRSKEESPELYFLVGDDDNARKIVDLYRTEQWENEFSEYVTIPSKFCYKYGIEDISMIYTINDLNEINKIQEIKKYIILLNLKDLISRIPQYNNSNGLPLSEERAMRELSNYYSELKINNSLINEIYSTLVATFDKEIAREDIIKLINCYFWLKLAYPEEWKAILYFPGIIAKQVVSIPVGVNISLKEIPSLDVILFLEKIILQFFTRESVDFFEKKAQKERDLRLATFREAYHDIGRNIIPPILEELGKPNVDNVKLLVEYLRNKLEVLRLLSIDERKNNQSVEPFLIKERIENLHVLLSFENKNKLRFTFSSEKECKIQVYPLFFDLIFENLISNSGRHGGRPRNISIVPININISDDNDSIVIKYQDEGKGFEESEKEKVDQWTKGIFTDEELKREKGIGFWMLQKACDSIGFKFDREWGNKIDGKVYKPYFQFIYRKRG